MAVTESRLSLNRLSEADSTGTLHFTLNAEEISTLDGQGGGDALAELSELDILQANEVLGNDSPFGSQTFNVTSNTTVMGVECDSLIRRSPMFKSKATNLLQTTDGSMESVTNHLEPSVSPLTVYSDYPQTAVAVLDEADNSRIQNEVKIELPLVSSAKLLENPSDVVAIAEQSSKLNLDGFQLQRPKVRFKLTRFTDLEPVQEEDEEEINESLQTLSYRAPLQKTIECFVNIRHVVCKYKWQLIVVGAFALGVAGGVTTYSLNDNMAENFAS